MSSIRNYGSQCDQAGGETLTGNPEENRWTD